MTKFWSSVLTLLASIPDSGFYALNSPSDENGNINDDSAFDYEESDSASAAESEARNDDISADEYHPSDLKGFSDSDEIMNDK
ncbi:hypothetical protein GN958_ATG06069 [Phytophthora infestans]|uniref:Secreted RxLR effector peptide protein n=1 Tax=Phytophthora infestans TaxID=4787 RepID=A0A8S9UZW4_PHYIN|nr:hypothetical protein GN958_ATG06069 [Phytophthora infestans]